MPWALLIVILSLVAMPTSLKAQKHATCAGFRDPQCLSSVWSGPGTGFVHGLFTDHDRRTHDIEGNAGLPAHKTRTAGHWGLSY